SLHRQGSPEMPPEILYLSVTTWSRLNGIIWLELNGRLRFFVGDISTFYSFEVKNLIRDAGLAE
ncbi:MAG: TetR/AcrR family transcriptional regulator, partial [Chloroflexota bacterium]